MIRTKKITVLFLALSLMFTAISLQDSSALSYGYFERRVAVRTAEDANAVLKLEGLSGNRLLNLDNNYQRVGSITNQSKREINLRIKITPDITVVIPSNYKLDFKIGKSRVSFSKNTAPTAEFLLRISPGETVDLEGSLMNNLFGIVTVSLDFTAEASDRSFALRLEDTINSRRRILCY